MKKLLAAVCLTTTLFTIGPAFGTILFTDDFEGGLGQWTGKSGGAINGAIVGDPAGGAGNALTFLALNSAGDMYSAATFAAGTYWLSFDYYGDTRKFNPPNTDTGGYVGISEGLPGNHTWLYATGTASGASDVLIDDDSWHSYTFSFSSLAPFHLMIEDFIGSLGGPGDAYFDNFVIRDSNADAVPEPATMLLFASGLAALSGARLRRKKSSK